MFGKNRVRRLKKHMSTTLQGVFIGYIATHMIAIALALWVFFEYIKKDADVAWLRIMSLLSFGNFLLSAIFSGYFYSLFEQTIRPAVFAGSYWWIDRVLAETHVYALLFIPIMGFVITLTMYIANQRLLRTNRLKHAITPLVLLTVFSGIAVLLVEMGMSRSFLP